MGSKIGYSFKLDDDLHVVHIEAHGILDPLNVQELSRKAREMASKSNCGIFYDLTDITLDASITDIFKFTKKVSAQQDLHKRNVRIAFLISSGAQLDEWKLFDLESRNCGLLNRVFVEDEKSALIWASGNNDLITSRSKSSRDKSFT